MSIPFLKASLECSCGRASAPSAPLPGVASCCVVPGCASCYSSLWFVQLFIGVAVVTPLGWILCCCYHSGGCFVVGVSLQSPLLSRCFTAKSVMAPHPRMLCHFDGRCLRRMLCSRAVGSSSLADALPPCCSSSGYLAAVASSRADALSLLWYQLPWRMLCHQGGCLVSLGWMLCHQCCWKLASSSLRLHFTAGYQYVVVFMY
jgi:hypothetical protein